jgi:hypothetical protein
MAIAAGCSSQSAGTGGAGGGAGAGGAPPACETPDPVPTFALGTGEVCFEPVTPGSEIPLMSGPQGGYHLWISMGCADCANDQVLVYGVKDMAGAWVVGTPYSESAAALKAAGPWQTRVGMQAGMPGVPWDPTTGPPPKGTPLKLYGAVQNADGSVLHEAEVDVVLGDTVAWDPCDANPTDPCCVEGCVG